MNSREVVVHVEQRQRRDVVVQLLTEGVRQPRKAPHVHSHVQVLPLDITRADVSRVGLTNYFDALGAQTLRRAVAFCPSGSLP
jgi:hypothetical protein